VSVPLSAALSAPLSVTLPLELLLDEPPSSPPPLELLLDVDPPLDDELLEDESEAPSEGPPLDEELLLDDEVASDTVASKVEPSAPDDPLLDDEVASDTVASKGVEPSAPDDPPLDDEDEPDTVASPDELPPLADPLLEDAPLEDAPLDDAPLDDAASELPCAMLESPASGFSVVVTPPPHPEVMQAETATRAPRRASSGRPRKPFVRRTDMTVPPFKRSPSIGYSTINARPPRQKTLRFWGLVRGLACAYFAPPRLSLRACELARASSRLVARRRAPVSGPGIASLGARVRRAARLRRSIHHNPGSGIDRQSAEVEGPLLGDRRERAKVGDDP
jgi:hypothetical protein